MIQKASAALGAGAPSALFWGQGEQDASFLETASVYGQNLAQFFTDVRSDWLHEPAGKIGFFRIGTELGWADQVRAAELSVDQADPNAESFDAANFPTQADHVHYTNVGLDDVGDAFYQLYRGWLGAAGPGQQLALTTPGTLLGTAGDDTLQGSVGDDALRGGAGNDFFFGGAGADIVNGNTGADTIHGDAGDDTLSGGQGSDAMFGEADNDVLFGNLGGDSLDGGFGHDLIRGGQGSDSIDGGSGDDWISGDRGSDTITGGTGADTFHSFADAGLDRILDFNAAEGDRVLLDVGTSYTVSQVGPDVVVQMSGGQVVLANIQLTSLPDGWIVVG
jgi:Ca2+-binding RTX toxin-like protein